jgi:hypothetical protein
MWKWILAATLVVSVARSAAAQITATRLDGTTLAGELRSWTATEVVIAAAQGDQSIRVDELLSLSFDAAPAERDTRPPIVELVDGSTLPISDYRVAGTRATATVATVRPPPANELSIAVRLIAAVRLQPLAATVASQWDEIRRQHLPSDVLVITKRGGESLDYVEGVVGNVTREKVEFKMEGESTDADRPLVAGVVYFRRDSRPAPEARGVVAGRSGLRAIISQADVVGDIIRLKTVSGVELAWPLADIHAADFSAGKIAYLSDLEPVSEKWTPLVSLPTAASSAASYGRARRDRSPFGRPLTLWLSGDAASAAGHGTERTFAKGLSLRSRSELVYRLPTGFRRFVALAGIDPATSDSGNVAVTIRGDEQVLLELEIAGNKSPVPIDLEVAGMRRLSIVVDYGRNLDHGDWLILGDARLVK